MVMPLYIGGAALYNYKVKGARGAEVMKLTPDFWSSFFGNVKAGFVFVFNGFNPNAVSSSGSAGKYDGMGAPATSSEGYQTAGAASDF